MLLNPTIRTCAAAVGVLFATMGEVSASNVALALGGNASVAGYQVTLDDATVVWDFSNGTADPVRDPLSRKELPGGLVQVLGFTKATVQPFGLAQVLTKEAKVQTNYSTLTLLGSVQAQVAADASLWDQGNGALKQVLAPGGAHH
jgi:hypothetical protein